MLLRSITKHVKDQNWFAVFLDFFIVVVGILIALQITNWNEAANAAQKEAKILKQLHSEFIETNDQMRKTDRYNDSCRDANTKVLRIIRDRIEPEDKSAFLDLLANAVQFGSPPVQPATLTEIFSSGGFTDLSSPTLKNALTQYRERMIDTRRMSNLALERISTPKDGFHNVIHINPDYRLEGESFLAYYDWDRLPEARQQYQVILFSQEALAHRMEELIELGEMVVTEIEKVQQ